MSIEQFIQNLISLVNSKSPLSGQSPLVIDQETIDTLLSQPTLDAAINNAIVALTGSNSPISPGDIRAAAQQSSEPQLGDPRYDHLTSELPAFLGVPRNYSVDGVSIYTTDENGDFLFYKQGSQYSLIANEPPEVVAALQAELVNAGLLKMGTFIPGRWSVEEDAPETEAFKTVLERANKTGDPDFTNSLRWFVDNQETMEAFEVEPAYLPPDYETVAQQVTNLFRNDQEIRRDPKPYEIKLLADQLIADSEKAWKANQPPKIDIGDITGEELMSGDLGNHIVYDETVSEDSQINPTANMLATFDRITQNERERISDYDDIQRTNGIIIDSITGAPR